MAGLEAAYRQEQALLLQQPDSKSVQRLVADPNMSVRDIASALGSYMRHHGTSDLWALVAPPPTAPTRITWKTPPCPDWVCKVMGLHYELLDIAPNTKVASVKLQRAIMTLHSEKALHVPDNKRLEDHVERIDVAIRTTLAMIRTLHETQKLKNRVLQMITAKDTHMLKLTLAKVNIPSNTAPAQDDEEQHMALDNYQLVQQSSSKSAPMQQHTQQQQGGNSMHNNKRKRSLQEVKALFDNILQISSKPPSTQESEMERQTVEDADLIDGARSFTPKETHDEVRKQRKRNKQPKGIKRRPSASSQQAQQQQGEAQQQQGEDQEAEQPRHANVPISIQMKYRNGCGKCRKAPWCTVSCYRYRGQI